jgi:hypothetical protein
MAPPSRPYVHTYTYTVQFPLTSNKPCPNAHLSSRNCAFPLPMWQTRFALRRVEDKPMAPLQTTPPYLDHTYILPPPQSCPLLLSNRKVL